MCTLILSANPGAFFPLDLHNKTFQLALPTFPLAHPSKDLIILMEGEVQIVKDITFQ
jgi:hypothetical protein